MKDLHFTGGSADIYKCFDQVNRKIVNKVLKRAGMPSGIRKAYIKYVNDLNVVNTVAGAIGEPFKKPTGIPQWDPFSMMVIALLLRPWIIEMRQMGVEARILADDLLIFTHQH